jgi:5-methylthioribose kinase
MGFMFPLTAENAVEYVRRLGWAEADDTRATWLSGGVSNIVLRIETPTDRFVLKQSCPQLRTRDAWFSDVDRIYREIDVMQALLPHLPDIVPKVRFVDRDNFAFAMDHAPLEAIPWKEQMLAGEVNPAMGALAGRMLGRMHEASLRHRVAFEAFRDGRVFDQLRIDPFYRRLKPRRPEVADRLDQLIDELTQRDDGLCHGDYTPKNMLVHGAGFTLVDYETAYFGDPTFDLGLCLAHLALKAMRDDEHHGLLIEAIRRFLEAYRAERTANWADLERRSVAHLAACMLTRLDGTSPVDYLTDERKRDLARAKGIAILNDRIECFADAFAASR